MRQGTPETILIATGNPGKLREVRSILADVPARLVSLADFPGLPEAVENAETFKGNAEIKARHYAQRTGLWTLADDSGLEVDALGGAPGVRSARYAGLHRDDAANNAKLIAQLKGVAPQRRTARFRCAVALADPQGNIVAGAEGRIEGVIIDEARGTNGFGYDPHFLVPKYGKTTAEMPPELKNRLSHRGRALQALAGSLRKVFATDGPR